ncbi:type III secretion system export apparatus subunit SctT [Desulfovibrio inopinatus]|uniref:type III secretion system export apparatus subunit SctT n=1 Tax=Desulfovibrio inopinatus TaxID=102109 RepID=UPI0004014205|nr:type III secretion system export apparatus subunit SctT [Desulfovibrio inopinatus]
MEISQELITVLHRLVLVSVLGMARMVPIFSMVPYLGGKLVNQVVRNAMMLGLVLFIFPAISVSVPENANFSWHVLGLAVKEVCIGLLIGFELSLFFWAVEGAGKVLDSQRELMSAGTQDPISGEQTSPLGSLLLHVAVVYFVMAGGLMSFLTMLFDSYRVWPVYSFFPAFDGSAFGDFLAGQLHLLFEILIVVAAPLSIMFFLSDFGLGLVARVASQLNVFQVSMALKSGLASAILIVYMFSVYFHICAKVAKEYKLPTILTEALK